QRRSKGLSIRRQTPGLSSFSTAVPTVQRKRISITSSWPVIRTPSRRARPLLSRPPLRDKAGRISARFGFCAWCGQHNKRAGGDYSAILRLALGGGRFQAKPDLPSARFHQGGHFPAKPEQHRNC